MPTTSLRGLREAADPMAHLRPQGEESFQDPYQNEALEPQAAPPTDMGGMPGAWDGYDASLGQIAQDPSAVSQNWDLAHLQDPAQAGMPTQGQTPWSGSFNTMRHRGAMMGKEIGFDPGEEMVSQNQGELDRIDQSTLRNEQLRGAAPNLSLTGLRAATGK